MCISKYIFSFSFSVFENDLTLKSLSFSHLWLWLMYILMCFAIIWSILKKKYKLHKLVTSKELIFADILLQLMFENIWIDLNQLSVIVIKHKLKWSVFRSVESDTTSQKDIIQNNKRLCWHCFYLQKIIFLTQSYHIWLELILKINRRQTAVKEIFEQAQQRLSNVQLAAERICTSKQVKWYERLMLEY